MLDANFSEFQNIYLDISVISWPRLNTCIIGLRLGVILNGFNDTQATGLSRKNSWMTQVQTTVAKNGRFFQFFGITRTSNSTKLAASSSKPNASLAAEKKFLQNIFIGDGLTFEISRTDAIKFLAHGCSNAFKKGTHLLIRRLWVQIQPTDGRFSVIFLSICISYHLTHATGLLLPQFLLAVAGNHIFKIQYYYLRKSKRTFGHSWDWTRAVANWPYFASQF